MRIINESPIMQRIIKEAVSDIMQGFVWFNFFASVI